MPLATLIPAEWCVAATLTDEQMKTGYVVHDMDTELKVSKLFVKVFANLNLGGVLKLGGAEIGAPTKLVYDDELKAIVLVACARHQVSRYARPSVRQAISLLQDIGVPRNFGCTVFRDIGMRILRYIDTHVSSGEYPNAIVVKSKRAYWKAHTVAWDATTTYDEIQNDTSATCRLYQPPQSTAGLKTIMDGVTATLAITGIWDGPAADSHPTSATLPMGLNTTSDTAEAGPSRNAAAHGTLHGTSHLSAKSIFTSLVNPADESSESDTAEAGPSAATVPKAKQRKKHTPVKHAGNGGSGTTTAPKVTPDVHVNAPEDEEARVDEMRQLFRQLHQDVFRSQQLHDAKLDRSLKAMETRVSDLTEQTQSAINSLQKNTRGLLSGVAELQKNEDAKAKRIAKVEAKAVDHQLRKGSDDE